MNDNIIKVKFSDDSKPKSGVIVKGKKNYEQTRCHHGAIVIDEQYRLVECEQCNCVIEPFELLLRRAKDAEAVIREIVDLGNKRDELRKSVDCLLKEEKNTKARLRSARSELLMIENKKLQHEGKIG
nr:hypothetical protein [Providencia stuartii]ELR5082476.1 hypothetical protein [Providencia stuartii]